MKKNRLSAALLVMTCLVISGCKLDEGDDATFPEYKKTGTLIGSPVSNMKYDINGDISVDRRTNFFGQFFYEEGDFIRFYVGDYQFPRVLARSLITPMNLAGSKDINDQSVINVAYLLQALDEDHNPENGITINDNVEGGEFYFNFDQSFDDFIISDSMDELIFGYLDGMRPDYDDVVDHLNRQLGLRGTWVSSDQSVTISFLKDLSMLVNSKSGYEFGQYDFDSELQELELSISDDLDGNYGFGPLSKLDIITLNNTSLLLKIDNVVTSYQRTDDSVLGIDDTWSYNDVDSGERYLLILLKNFSYILTRISDSGGEVDRGSYIRSETGLNLVSSQLDNGNLGIMSFENKSRSYDLLLSDKNLKLYNDDTDILFSRE